MKKAITLVALLSLTSIGWAGTDREATNDRLDHAGSVLHEIMAAPDKGIPDELLEKAQCVVIVPGMKKAAFIVGGQYGKGFIECRRASGKGWSAPAAVKVEGGSFGFQIGGSETDAVMLVMNKRDAGKLLSSKFTLGVDATRRGRTGGPQFVG